MNAAQLAAYEALCAKVPEARCPDIYWKDDQQGWFTSVAGHRGVDIPMFLAFAILTAHLEWMLPPGWQLAHRANLANWCYALGIPEGPAVRIVDPDRFVALCRAVEESR